MNAPISARALSPEQANWTQVHAELQKLAQRKATYDYDEAQWLVAGLRVRLHEKLGYGSYREYLERVFGYNARDVRERLRVALALEKAPVLAGELRDGELCWSAARELSRVVTPETEEDWVDAARGKPMRQIEGMVRTRRPGNAPADPPTAEPDHHALSFEVSGETFALWREAVRKLREEHGGELSEEDAFLAMARMVLAGPKDDGRASYQIMVNTCEQCGAGSIEGRGETIVVDDAIIEMAECDAQLVAPAPEAHEPVTHVGRATQTIPPARRRFVLRRDHGRCVVPGCRSATFVDIHHLVPRSEGGQHDPDSMVICCGVHHRAAHVGRLLISGSVSAGLRFAHADGSPYGSPRIDPREAEAWALAFNGLRHLGFKEGPARRALDQLPPHVERSPAELIRAALVVLT